MQNIHKSRKRKLIERQAAYIGCVYTRALIAYKRGGHSFKVYSSELKYIPEAARALGYVQVYFTLDSDTEEVPGELVSYIGTFTGLVPNA